MRPAPPPGDPLPLSVRRRGDEVWVAGAGALPSDPEAPEVTALVHQLGRARADAVAAGASALHWEADGDVAVIDRVAGAVGLPDARRVLQMRRPLPLERELVDAVRPLAVRPLRPGTPDEEAWVRTNARAFHDHPAQGRETLSTLRATMAEPWFRTEDLLLVDAEPGVDEGGTLAGSCWTKVHPSEAGQTTLGEIYVIGIDPDHAGQGLGRRLVVAGLEHLADRCEVALLYVEGDNAPALHLYESLGFSLHSVRHVRSARLGEP